MTFRIFNIINNVIKKKFKIFNRLIFIQFVQSYDVFSNNLPDGISNQFGFIIDLFEEIQKKIQIFDTIIMTLENVQDVIVKQLFDYIKFQNKRNKKIN